MKFTDNTELLDICLSGHEWSLLLDLDCALADVALDPDAAAVPRRLVSGLLTLNARLGGALAIVSGRAIEAVDRILTPASFNVAGKHGGELRVGKSRFSFGPSREELIGRAAHRLRRLSQVHPGCLVVSEDTRIAVHWRLAPHLEQIVLDHVLELASELGSDFRIQREKWHVEILPAGTGEAKALSLFMSYPPFKARKPIFVGDDHSDEATLGLVRALDGFSVHVGPGDSAAEYTVKDRAVARRWLMSWAQAGKERRAAQFQINDVREVH